VNTAESSLPPVPAYRNSTGIIASWLTPAHLPCDASGFGVAPSATIFEFVTDRKKAKRFVVSGLVQGVGFRYFTQGVAERLNLHGYVRNLRDGRVEAYAIGTPKQLAEFGAELQRGPGAANVMMVTEEEDTIHPQYDNAFVITYDA
jgi:acylphosphatase